MIMTFPPGIDRFAGQTLNLQMVGSHKSNDDCITQVLRCAVPTFRSVSIGFYRLVPIAFMRVELWVPYFLDFPIIFLCLSLTFGAPLAPCHLQVP